MDLKKAFNSPIVLLGGLGIALGAFVLTCDKGLKVVQRAIDPVETVQKSPAP